MSKVRFMCIQKEPAVKRYGNLYKQIYDLDNLRLAHQNAKRGKGWYSEVQAVDADLETYLKRLQDMLINHTYKTSEYTSFIKKEGKKEREIFKLPYFPDRICQWAILQVIEPYILKRLTYNTYSAIPGKGIHVALKDVEKAMRTDVPNCQYCLKIDVKKYYPSINHEIMKEKFRKLFKDPELLWLLDEIIDSISTSPRLPDTGIPIGNYLSQYCGNYFLSDFHRWLKEVKKVKHVYGYMDDVTIFGKSKEELHALKDEIDLYFFHEKLTMKENWQIFPTYTRGVDFVGYRVFLDYTLLRKSSCKSFKKKAVHIQKKCSTGKRMNYSEWCSINSYDGWMKHCDSYRLKQKYIVPLKPHVDRYYNEVIKPKKKGGKNQ